MALTLLLKVTFSQVELPLVDRESCQTQLRPLEMMGPYFILDDSFMCALGEASVDSCKGSGGSPLVCPMQDQPGRYMLSGMVTFSTNCSFDRYPSVYARVASARQWIDDKMADNGYPITSYTDY
ncbi:hypothetical protein evm_012883 [Chilo suppressalis]|nr:hypothetical protein evm_012883 [Chilo suppressalis]